MKLLFVYRFCGFGGVETSILTKLDALAAVGIDGHALFGEFYGSGGSGLATDPRVTIGLGKDSVRATLRRGFEAVSIVDHPGFVDLLDEMRVVPHLVFETHASLPEAVARFHSNLNHPRISAVVVPSAFNRRMVEKALAVPKPVVVIPNPVDGTRFHPASPTPQAVVGLPSGGPILLWVGRLEREKNPEEFVRIVQVVLESGFDVRPLIVGDAYSTPEYAGYKERLLSTVSERWRARFTFCRSVPYEQMPGLFGLAGRSGGCLVSTSLFESAPMTFIEAMSCMCPVVSSEVGGVGEMVNDGINGRLYRSGGIPDAAEAIMCLTDERQSSKRQALVERARSAVSEKHAPQVVGGRYLELLESLRSRVTDIASPRSSRPAAAQAAAEAGGVVPGLVTTVIPVYNRADLLLEAVESVLSQTYDKIEIILVDDGSTDGTSELCDRLAREYEVIEAIHIPHQGRAGLAREAGRLAAKGEYVQYLDSDDLLMPAKFSRMVAALERNPNCDIAYCYTRRYRIGSTPPESPAELTGQTFETMLPAFLSKRYWCTSTPIYRRSLCDKAGAWSDLPFWEDIEYDLRLATFSPRLCHCKEWLTEIRDHDSGRQSGSRFLESPVPLEHAVRGAVLIYGNIKRAGLGYDDPHVRAFVDDVRLMYNRCRHFGLDQPSSDCASIVMDATGTGDPDSVGQYSVRALLATDVGALRVLRGQTVSCPIQVVNHSTVSFHSGEFATELAYHLRNADGTMRRFDNPKKIFEEPLRPGESRILDLPIYAPDPSGLYYLEFDLLWAGITWLNSLRTSACFVKLLICESFAEQAWWLHLEPGNSAEVQSGPSGSVRLDIRAAPTETAWHIQANYERFSVSANQEYELRFRARAEGQRRVGVGVSMAHGPWDNLGLYREIDLSPQWQRFAMRFRPSASDESARIHFDAGGSAIALDWADVELSVVPDGEPLAPPPFAFPGRLQMDIGLRPLSYWWGTDRGLPVHRYYLEQFLTEFSSDIRGRCLEFQDPQYTPRFGADAVETLDILHIDDSNPRATLIADLTTPNDLPGNQFDCIVCTHVLHVIVEAERAIAEMFRILKPGGTLLIAVPHISMYGPEYGEVWRFTPKGLEVLLGRAFGPQNVLVRAYGNSLTAAGEIRGVVSSEFLKSELNTHDPRFPVEVCARAVKGA